MSAPVPAGWTAHEFTDRVFEGGVARTKFQVLTRRRRRRTLGSASVTSTLDSSGADSGANSGYELNSYPNTPLNFPSITSENGHGHKPYMGAPGYDRATVSLDGAAPDPVAGVLLGPATAFGDLPSVRAMGTGRRAIVVGFDTEFTTTDGGRLIDSYQFAVPDPVDPSFMVEVVILPLTGDRVSLHGALWEVVVAAELWRSPLAPVIKDGGAQRVALGPLGVARADFWTADPDERREALAKLKLPLVLACHFGSADLTAFRADGRVGDHLTRLTSAAGGLVTLLPFRSQRQGDGHGKFWQSLSISVRDTMAHAPAGKKSLKDLGQACGVSKIEVPDGWIADMSGYRAQHLTDFLEYGINDSVIVVEYLARLWGDGVLPPITLSGGAASALVDSGKAYFGLSTSGEFRRVFAGLVDEDEGVDAIEEEDRLTFYAKRGRNPVDGAAAQLSSAFARGYHGGLNSCPMPGYYPFPTVDIDAQNAYPTAMACVEDLDWEAGAIEEVFHETWLARETVPSPTTPFVGFVSFTFPHDTVHPCLPVVADGTLVYPRTSEGTAGTWVCGPELWLALQLGAEAHCQIGFLGRVLDGPDGGRSLSLRRGVKQLIDDRNAAKHLFGKGSIEELTLKTGVNSVYGKTAQDVAEQRAWNAHEQAMDAVGGSSITSPYHAAMTTSLVRAQLLATMNQLHNVGRAVYSVTTDGFITNATCDEVNSLDLYGLAPVLAEAREALTGDSTIWEAKHSQDDLVNFTTRGNVSLSLGGVCAHNGLKAPRGITTDSIEDREFLLRAVATRDGRVPNPYTRFPSFQELSRKEDRRDFIPSLVNRSVSMDHDLKRRPVLSSMKSEWVPLPDGSRHEMATFVTEPWETLEDCLRAREIAREMAETGCLRTVAQCRAWDIKFTHGKGRRITTPQRAVLMSLVMAHRQGVVTIPTLADRQLSVAERLEWLSKWGLGTVSRGDWDNARRPERASQMLPLNALDPYLDRMVSMPSGARPADADRLPL